MASPTEAEMETQWQNAVAIIENFDTNNTIANDINTYEVTYESDFVSEQASASQQVRTAAASVLDLAEALLTPVFLGYALHIVEDPAGSADEAIDRMYDYFIAQSKTIVARVFAYGTPAAGASNTGTGTLRRLTVDENAYDLEAQFTEVKTFTCSADGNTGTNTHQTSFAVKGQAEGVDSLLIRGSGLETVITSKSSADSILGNPTFSQYAIAGTVATGAPYTLVSGDTITNWQLLDAAGTATDETLYELTVTAADIYRIVDGDTTPTAVRVDASHTLKQDFSDVGISLNALVPVDLLLPIKRESSATGNLVVTMGAMSKTIDTSTLNNAAYNAVFFDQDKDQWPLNITLNDAALTLAWTRTAGELVYDELTLVAYDLIDGTYWVLHSGATPFLLADSFTATDTLASDSKLQQWLWRAFNRYLPSATTATGITAAGGRTFTFADSNPDTLTLSTGSLITDNYVPGQTLTVAGTSSNNGTYTIDTVTALVITVISTDTFVAEGPLSATATLAAVASVSDPA